MDAAAMLPLVYRKVKRMWRRYQADETTVSSAELNQEKIFRCGGRAIRPTLDAGHLTDGDGIVVDHETLRRWMLAEHL